MSDHEIVPLPGRTQPPPEAPPSAPGRLHGLSIAGMAGAALVGIAIMFLLITVSWTEGVQRLLVAGLFLCAVAFLASASAAVLSAARDTYAAAAKDAD